MSIDIQINLVYPISILYYVENRSLIVINLILIAIYLIVPKFQSGLPEVRVVSESESIDEEDIRDEYYEVEAEAAAPFGKAFTMTRNRYAFIFRADLRC